MMIKCFKELFKVRPQAVYNQQESHSLPGNKSFYFCLVPGLKPSASLTLGMVVWMRYLPLSPEPWAFDSLVPSWRHCSGSLGGVILLKEVCHWEWGRPWDFKAPALSLLSSVCFMWREPSACSFRLPYFSYLPETIRPNKHFLCEWLGSGRCVTAIERLIQQETTLA